MTRLLYCFFFYAMTGTFSACHSPGNKQEAANTIQASAETYTRFILSLDTMTTAGRLHRLDSLTSFFDSSKANGWHFYLQGWKYNMQKQPDSALFFFQQIPEDGSLPDLMVLKSYSILSCKLNPAGIVDPALVAEIMKAIKAAEKANSVYTYRLYDLLANAYHNNRNIEKALEYTQLYYSHHPFRQSVVTQQRYHDISFILAVQLDDTLTMRQHLDSSRYLAIQSGDSMALMRTYENNAQLLSMTGRFAEAVASNKLFFQYLEKRNLLQGPVFNNMAQNFRRNKQLDSAISYFKRGIVWNEENNPGANLVLLYRGLSETYAQTGDFKQSRIALDSSYNNYQRNTQHIQADKIEEIHTRYQTEKKDQAISVLRNTDLLNKKIILQQRWIFAGSALLLLAALLFAYNSYRRRLLKKKNENLIVENKRLLLEQKTRQLQLNPHFIYNAIANLQGLVRSDPKQANTYLVAFSKLVRAMLELNRAEYISLEEEITSLESYLQLQQIRYGHSFEYGIETGDLDTHAIQLPPMLVQPFVENAIEHGFKNISYKGRVHIRFAINGGQLQIQVKDNGAGADVSMQPTGRKKSLSRIITQERLDILFNQKRKQASFETTPVIDGSGYIVNIHIPVLTETDPGT